MLMLKDKMLSLKYSLLGSAMLTMAGCSSLGSRNAVPEQHSVLPDKDKDAKVEKAVVSIKHKTSIRKQQVLAHNTKATTFLLPDAEDEQDPATAQPVSYHPEASGAQKPKTTLDQVAVCALRQRGKAYCWGGNTPMQGFDCSGLTQYSFRQGASVHIPRTAAAQYAAATKIPAEQAEKGDLVFFKTHGNKVSHVGLYLGRERFVHAPRTGKNIQISKLEGYWKSRLVGFGRIPGACRPMLPKSVI